MDLYPLQSKVAPIQAPVESLAVKGYSQGVRDAEFVPTDVTQIAQAVSGGIEAYQSVQANQQNAQIKDQIIERNDRQAALESDPAILEAQKLRIQSERDEYARGIKSRQRQDELLSVLQSGDNAKIVGAVTSGAYADVFSENPNLEKYAVKVAAPNMTPEQQQSFITRQGDAQYQLMLNRNKLQLATENAKAESAYLTNDTVKDILATNQDLDARSLARRVDFVPAGRYKYDEDGRVLGDPSTRGYLTLDERENTELDNKDKFDFIDRETRRVIARGVSKDDKNVIQGYISTSKMVPGSPLQDTDVTTLIRNAQGKQAGVKDPRKAPDTAPSGQVTPLPPEATNPFSLLEKNVSNAKVATTKGTLEPASADFVAANVVGTLEIPDELKEKYLPRIRETVDQSMKFKFDVGLQSAVNRTESAARMIQNQVSLATDILDDTWTKRDNGKFTQADVDKHNADVEAYEQSLRRRAVGDFSVEDICLAQGHTLLLRRISTSKKIYQLL